MPNCVPQSPTWFTLSVGWWVYSRILQTDSPMIVERRWPTCMSLAMLGEEKSTTVRGRGEAGGDGRGSPLTTRSFSFDVRYSVDRAMLMKPGPATSSFWMRGWSIDAARASATSRGALKALGFGSFLKSSMALLHWYSPFFGSFVCVTMTLMSSAGASGKVLYRAVEKMERSRERRPSVGGGGMRNLEEMEKAEEKRGERGTDERKDVRAGGSVMGLKVGTRGRSVVAT
mmetsp:Transcript_18485/g.37772  ORF Transcript_18485/g.37772 Transcript_18485/m.37772 type:complete len:229 (-) Transcript_18485:558-1244(-)